MSVIKEGKNIMGITLTRKDQIVKKRKFVKERIILKATNLYKT